MTRLLALMVALVALATPLAWGDLADGSSPLEELVAAHERALLLHAEAQSSLAKLKARADEAAKLLSE